MKSTLLPFLAAAALLTGCQTTEHHHGSAAPAASAPSSSFDTSALVAAFKNADLASNQVVQSVVSALSGKDYSGALGSLQKLAAIPGLTESQASAVHQLISSVSSRSK